MADEFLISSKWAEIKAVVDALELDVAKNDARGNAAAGVRVRKGLRHLQTLSKELVKVTLATDKANKASK